MIEKHIVDKKFFFLDGDNAITYHIKNIYKNVLNCLSFYCLALVTYHYANTVHDEIKFMFIVCDKGSHCRASSRSF